jgi:CheY-like chemotaxis protein
MATDSCPVCVLLIEDDERLREALCSYLEARKYAVLCAEDGEQALEVLKTAQRPCLILLDTLTLPIDYGKLFAALEQDDRVASLPMVLVSVSAPALFSRPATVKQLIDFDIFFRLVKQHCCGEDPGGEKAPGRDTRDDAGP